MITRICHVVTTAMFSLGLSAPAFASGHGPVFGAATPTLGRGGWSVDQAWTFRAGEDEEHQQMLKTMLSFGITENLQVSGSVPLAMGEGDLAPARMMSAMSSDREFEALTAYRFQRRTVGIGGREESTFYVGGTVPFESHRSGVEVGPSIEGGISTGTRPARITSGSAVRCSISWHAVATNSAPPVSSPPSTAIVRGCYER